MFSKKNILILSLSALLLFSFFVLTLAAKFDKTITFDFNATVKIQDHMPGRLKPYLIKIVELGSWQIMSVIVFGSMLIQRKRFWKIGVLFILIALIEIYGKYQLQHPPPPQFMLLRYEHLNLPKYYVRDTASFPSGHAARPAFLMMVWIPYLWQSLLGYIKRHTEKQVSDFKLQLPFGFTLTRENSVSFQVVDFGRIALFLSAFAALASFTFIVGFTKIYLGEHWTSDVIGGWLLGSGLGLLTHIKLKTQSKPL
jgi:membrane-associated phospholipid phosphatase